MLEILSKVGIWAVVGIAAYVAYRWLSSSRESKLTDYERELKDVLTSDQYKVKGRFEE